MPLPGTRRTMKGDPLAHLIVACCGRSDECDRPPAACGQLFREAAFSAASSSDDEHQPWGCCFLCRCYGLFLSIIAVQSPAPAMPLPPPPLQSLHKCRPLVLPGSWLSRIQGLMPSWSPLPTP